MIGFECCISMSALSPAFQSPGQPLLVVSCMVKGGSKCVRGGCEEWSVVLAEEELDTGRKEQMTQKGWGQHHIKVIF